MTIVKSGYPYGSCPVKSIRFHLKKPAAESHRMPVEAYGEHALGKT